MNIDEAKYAGTALMATVKHLMTGGEIAACEHAKSGDLEREFEDTIRQIKMDSRPFGEEALYEFEREDAEQTAYREIDEFNVLKRLSIQFSREIANWHDARNRARSRAVLKKGAKV